MSRIKLTLAYDGAPFEGWQSQPGGNTVQDTLEGAIREVGGGAVRVHGSGRTDSGVHALGQVAHFDPPATSMDAAAWLRALNSKLPAAVRVTDATEVAGDFHARFSALGKTYQYQIDTAAVLTPHRSGRVWHHPGEIDIDLLREACTQYVGEHDFAPFAANRRDGKEPSTVRSISRAEIEVANGVISITFSGNGFLYKMVRLLVGGAVRVSEGRAELAWLREMLTPPGVEKCLYCAPGCGLYLLAVDYRLG